MAIFIKKKTNTSNIILPLLYIGAQKKEVEEFCKRLGVKVSTHPGKLEKASLLSQYIENFPERILHLLNQDDLLLVDDFIKGGANHYVTRKIRPVFYALQEFGLVLTYVSTQKKEWHMIMPDTIREVLAPYYKLFSNHLAATGEPLSLEQFQTEISQELTTE